VEFYDWLEENHNVSFVEYKSDDLLATKLSEGISRKRLEFPGISVAFLCNSLRSDLEADHQRVVLGMYEEVASSAIIEEFNPHGGIALKAFEGLSRESSKLLEDETVKPNCFDCVHALVNNGHSGGREEPPEPSFVEDCNNPAVDDSLLEAHDFDEKILPTVCGGFTPFKASELSYEEDEGKVDLYRTS
jgi:hypothetical protein